ALVFAGLSNQYEGGNNDRLDIDLPGDQAALISAVAAANPNTVVILINGTPLRMAPWLESVPALLEAWYPGQEGGNAIADVLFGDANPSGKLPDTFPQRLEDNPTFGNFPGANGQVHYAEGIFVGYRHYDTREILPLFPFGYGLSYTTFEYDHLQVTPEQIGPTDPFQVSVQVRNTGDRAGKEVVQLYVGDLESSLERPVKELKAFAKIHLDSGETRTVCFDLGPDALSFYDPDQQQWIVEPGTFEIAVGGSSQSVLRQPLIVK
ncbi:MAG: beta-glucosidase, partial [Gemmatimonadetes bacterium]|nr:beta-glucosidase [Gemmatimonadota bacterium]